MISLTFTPLNATTGTCQYGKVQIRERKFPTRTVYEIWKNGKLDQNNLTWFDLLKYLDGAMFRRWNEG